MSAESIVLSTVQKFQKAYIDQGYYCFALDPENKIPRKPGWQKPVAESTQSLAPLGLCYAARLKLDDFLMDVDVRRDGLEDLARLKKHLNLTEEDFNTFTVQTGGNAVGGKYGRHIYFKKQSNLIHRASIKGFEGIELKTYGQWITGCGSKLTSGGIYKELHGWVGEIRELPLALAEFVSISDTDKSHERDIYDDSEGSRTRFREWLKYCAPIAIEGRQGDKTTLLVAHEGRSYGLEEESVIELMTHHWNDNCVPPWDAEELATKIGNSYKYAQNPVGINSGANDFDGIEFTSTDLATQKRLKFDSKEITTTKGKTRVLLPTLRNAVNLFDVVHEPPNPLNDLLCFNSFTQQIEFKKRAPWHMDYEDASVWHDHDAIRLREYFASFRGLNCATVTCEEAAIVQARRKGYNPLVDYLRSLEWDGHKRLDTVLIDYAQAPDNDYVRAVTKCTFIAGVARAFSPGCRHDHMLILENETQGTGKSDFVRAIGGKFYSDCKIKVDTDASHRNTVHAMIGSWILEVSEMAFLRRSDSESVKSFLTVMSDKVRLSFGRHAHHIPRTSIFIGTVNPQADGSYLMDRTGNRRYWPVPTGYLDTAGLIKDRDQIWAEAVVRYEDGEEWYLADRDIAKQALEQQSERVAADPWQDKIAIHLLDYGEPEEFSSSYIYEEVLELRGKELDRFAQMRVVECMRNLGYQRALKYFKPLKKSKKIWEKDILHGL